MTCTSAASKQAIPRYLTRVKPPMKYVHNRWSSKGITAMSKKKKIIGFDLCVYGSESPASFLPHHDKPTVTKSHPDVLPRVHPKAERRLRALALSDLRLPLLWCQRGCPQICVCSRCRARRTLHFGRDFSSSAMYLMVAL